MNRQTEQTLILNLLMLSYTVEAHRLNEQNVAHKGVFVRSGEPGILPISLVKNKPQRQRAAIQNEPVTLCGNSTESGIAFSFIDRIARGVQKSQFDVNDVSLFGLQQKVVPKIINAGID